MLLRTLALILLIGYPLSSLAQTNGDSLQKTRYFYENGQVSSEGTLRNGKPDGFWKSYYRNGLLKAEGNRKNFELDGNWIFYDRDGFKTSEINYQKGQRSGLSKKYLEGRLLKIDRYENNIQEGVSQFFYPDSSLQKEVPYVDGQQSGEGFEYSKDGRIITLLSFKNGSLIRKQNVNRFDQQEQKQGLWLSFHKNMAKKVEGPYLNDLKNGYWKYYKANGNLIKVEKWINGELQEGATEVAKVEVRKEIDPKTGKLSFKGAYQNGKPTGVHRNYDAEGKVSSATVYDQGIKLFEGIIDEQGRKQGPWKAFYKDGSLKSEGAYKDDLKVGRWRYYYTNNVLEQQGSYNAGRAQGMWEWYYSTGDLLREEEYNLGLEDGMSIEYNDTGAVIAQGTYVDGMKEGLWTSTINDHKEVGEYFEGLRSGVWKHYYLSNDQLRFEGAYETGLETGFHIYYYENGKVKERGNYAGGERQGIWEFFMKNGKRTVTIEYEDGVEVRYNGDKIDYGRRYEKALAEEKAREDIESDSE
ncbi:MAG: hypothetical protein NXI09_01730 [Bacteroidetes bacterium]|nr:hypothetical protein [Bacteroidota bacterium]